jgi:hypothetical protein
MRFPETNARTVASVSLAFHVVVGVGLNAFAHDVI